MSVVTAVVTIMLALLTTLGLIKTPSLRGFLLLLLLLLLGFWIFLDKYDDDEDDLSIPCMGPYHFSHVMFVVLNGLLTL